MAEAVERVGHIINETAAFAVRDQEEEGQPLETRFHPGANLLVVVGTPKAVDAARKVVAALNSPNSPAGPSPNQDFLKPTRPRTPAAPNAPNVPQAK